MHVPAFPCDPKDLTGAGDMFAGAFLYGITHGIAPSRGGASGVLPGDEGHHPDRRPAAPRHAAVLGLVYDIRHQGMIRHWNHGSPGCTVC